MIRFALLLVTALLLTSTGSANAFSTQSSDTYKGDNVSNFADPDEQQPAFLTGSGNAAQQQQQSYQPTVGEDQNTQRERYMGLTQSFDQSYSNK